MGQLGSDIAVAHLGWQDVRPAGRHCGPFSFCCWSSALPSSRPRDRAAETAALRATCLFGFTKNHRTRGLRSGWAETVTEGSVAFK